MLYTSILAIFDMKIYRKEQTEFTILCKQEIILLEQTLRNTEAR